MCQGSTTSTRLLAKDIGNGHITKSTVPVSSYPLPADLYDDFRTKLPRINTQKAQKTPYTLNPKPANKNPQPETPKQT